jgi:hypothetical protein
MDPSPGGKRKSVRTVSRQIAGVSGKVCFGGHTAMSAVGRAPKGDDWLFADLQRVRFQEI